MKTKYIIALAASALALAGCQKEQFAESCLSDAVTRFDVSVAGISDVNDTPVTKAAMSDFNIVSEGNEDVLELPLSCIEMSGITPDSHEVAATRATLYNTTGDNTHKLSEYLTEFKVTAWEGTSGTTNFIPADTKVKYITGTESYWSTVDDSDNVVEYVWKKNVSAKTFFAYANLPASGASVECTGAAGQTLTLTAIPDKDILMGFYQGDGTTGSPAVMTGTASIHFYHPMTAVRFRKGTVSDGVSITGISIEGVYTSGKTTQTASTGTDFVWSDLTGSATVRLSDVTVDDDNFIGDAFILIPQTFASDSKARIAVSLSDGSVLYTPLASLQWKAGYTNVYTINLDRNVIDVTVYENFNGTTKSNVCVRNTGTANAYVRVAVVANWVTAEGLAVEACDLSDLAINTTDWTHSGDFYYCKKAIRPGSSTPNLFDTYTAPSTKPDESLHVEMVVIAQGVELDYDASSTYPAKANTAWGITGVLDNVIQN